MQRSPSNTKNERRVFAYQIHAHINDILTNVYNVNSQLTLYLREKSQDTEWIETIFGNAHIVNKACRLNPLANIAKVERRAPPPPAPPLVSNVKVERRANSST